MIQQKCDVPILAWLLTLNPTLTVMIVLLCLLNHVYHQKSNTKNKRTIFYSLFNCMSPCQRKNYTHTVNVANVAYALNIVHFSILFPEGVSNKFLEVLTVTT